MCLHIYAYYLQMGFKNPAHDLQKAELVTDFTHDLISIRISGERTMYDKNNDF